MTEPTTAPDMFAAGPPPRSSAVPAIVIAIVVALVAAGIGLVVINSRGTDEATRAAGITPANSIGFVTVSLDPSIEQKRNLYGIVRRFPKAQVKDDFESTRDELLSQLVKQAGLDYQRDVEPWLGDEIAVAVLPAAPGERDPAPVVFVQVKDRDKAKIALDRAVQASAARGEPPAVYRFVDGFAAVIAGPAGPRSERVLDAVDAQSMKADGGLARARAFTGVVDELHGDRLVLGWIDSKAALQAMNAAAGASLPTFGKLAESAGPAAFDLHAGAASLVLEGVSRSGQPGRGGDPKLTRSLPIDTLGAFTVFDLQTTVSAGLDALRGFMGADPSGAIRQEFGLDVQADLLSWMGGESVIVAGPAPSGRAIPEFALVVEPTDRAKAQAAVQKMVSLLARRGLRFGQQQTNGGTAYVLPRPITDGVQPAFALLADRFVLASSPAYLQKIAAAATPGFGSTENYGSVVGQGTASETRVQLVLDMDAIRAAVEKAVPSSDRGDYDRDVKPNLAPIRAVGMVVRRAAGFDRAELKVTFR